MSDTKLDKIDSKIDKIQEKIYSIDITLAAQHESLKTHIRRTEILEKKVEPLEKHDIMLLGIIKLLALVALALGIIEGIIRVKNG